MRRLAAGIVRGVAEGRGAARSHLESAFERERLDGREKALLTELVYGTVRHLETLDHLLESCSSRGLEDAPDEVLSHLRVAAHQLVFLDHVPPAVAVSEAVESVRAPHLKRFANAVLRALARAIVARRADDAAPADVPATRRLPGRERGWIVLADDLLPDPARDPAGWLALATAHPLALARRWVARFGLERALEVARAGNSPPPVVLRANLLRTTREALLAELAREGLEARPGERPEAVLLTHPGDISKLAAFREGRATVQDETAMSVAPLTGARAGMRVLDLCAAPGGKATHLAELMGDAGLVVATDASGSRLSRIRENVERLGLRSVWTVETGQDGEPPGANGYDAVLVDAPCSNTGVLRRRVEARRRFEALDLPPLLALQSRLLRLAAKRVAPAGTLVYSTCSIEEEEDEAQVRSLLRDEPGFELREERLTLPARGRGDGGYAAVLVRHP